MNTRAEADALVRSLGALLGIALELDTQDACGLRIDDDFELTLRFETQTCALLAHAVVGERPLHDGEASLRRLLEANHLWDGSAGATWSVSGESVVLARLFPLAGLEASSLAAELARFVEVAERERERLKAQPQSSHETLPFGMFSPA